MNRFLLPLSIFIVVVIFLGVGLKLNPREIPSPLVGKAAPDFSQPQLYDEAKVFSPADLKGKVVVVDFWTTWCPPCKVEIPEYHRIMERVNNPDLTFVGVTFDSETPEDVLPFMKELKMTYPVTLANDAVDQGFGGHGGYPTTFLIGRDWKVYKQFVGVNESKMKELEEGINELLAAAPSAD